MQNLLQGVIGSYLNFNSPKVFEKLKKIPNLTVKIANADGFHVKGYLFEHADHQVAIIGSANFTRNALLKNYEWSLKVDSTKDSLLTKQLSSQLALLDEKSDVLTSNWIKKYAENWQAPQKEKSSTEDTIKITPNTMQKKSLSNLEKISRAKSSQSFSSFSSWNWKNIFGSFCSEKV